MGNRIFFTMINSKCHCLIYHVSVSIPKKGNLQRHFSSLHGKYNDDFPPNSKMKTLKLLSLKKELTEQQNTFVKSVSKPILATVASLKITHLLTKVLDITSLHFFASIIPFLVIFTFYIPHSNLKRKYPQIFTNTHLLNKYGWGSLII